MANYHYRKCNSHRFQSTITQKISNELQLLWLKAINIFMTLCAGIAFIGTLCTNSAVSVVEEYFTATSGAVSAHELGHRCDALCWVQNVITCIWWFTSAKCIYYVLNTLWHRKRSSTRRCTNWIMKLIIIF